MTTLKLSEAIRLGAMLKPQGSGWLHDVERQTTCAIGAALDASGILCNDYDVAYTHFPLLTMPATECPAAADGRCAYHPIIGVVRGNVADVIIGLNDSHKWTREQIADWVETIEVAQAVAGADQGGAMHGASIQETLIGTSPQR